MAHLRSLVVMCQGCDRRTATVELIDWHNRPMGKFCAFCGEKRHREQQDRENADAVRGTLGPNREPR